jgi:hypothetical protein
MDTIMFVLFLLQGQRSPQRVTTCSAILAISRSPTSGELPYLVVMLFNRSRFDHRARSMPKRYRLRAFLSVKKFRLTVTFQHATNPVAFDSSYVDIASSRCSRSQLR